MIDGKDGRPARRLRVTKEWENERDWDEKNVETSSKGDSRLWKREKGGRRERERFQK